VQIQERNCLRIALISIGLFSTFVSCFAILGLVHLNSIYSIKSNSEIYKIKGDTIAFTAPFTKQWFNSIFSGNAFEQSSQYNWSLKEKSFILASFQNGFLLLQQPSVNACIIDNVKSFPNKKYNHDIFSLFYNSHSYHDLNLIKKRNGFYAYTLIENNNPDTIATTVYSAYSIALLKNRIQTPGMTYLDKSRLKIYMENGDYDGYGAMLIHEILHLYNNEHPGSSIDDKYKPDYFINVVERCLNGTQQSLNF
jgi:hypothetical protein